MWLRKQFSREIDTYTFWESNSKPLVSSKPLLPLQQSLVIKWMVLSFYISFGKSYIEYLGP